MGGPVTIIPATAMRNNRNRLFGDAQPHDLPLNAAYYITPEMAPPEPPPPTVRYSSRPRYVLQPRRVVYRRTRTAPARAYNIRYVGGPHYRLRSKSANYFFDPRDYSQFSGPAKHPLPLYRTPKLPRVYPADNELKYRSSGPPGTVSQQSNQAYYRYGSWNPRTVSHAWYPAQTYASYPNSNFPLQRPAKRPPDKYPVVWRFCIKLAQLVNDFVDYIPVWTTFYDFILYYRTSGLLAGPDWLAVLFKEANASVCLDAHCNKLCWYLATVQQR